MNTKLHAVADANGRPLSFFMTAGQVSDYTGAAALLDDLPKAQWLLGDRGYDADWFRDALQAKGIQPCIPGRRSRNEPVRYDKRRYRRRSRIEIMFGRLKDWRRVATRYDRCPTAFFSAIALAATVIFWLGAPQGLSYGQRQSEQMVNKSLSVAAKYIKFRGFVRLDELEVTGSPLVMFHPRSS